jgi:UDP-N-acetylmuramyl pentapeptide phosphotransferase/UDP-N-acetylglucosamine-1-phosphate transferase
LIEIAVTLLLIFLADMSLNNFQGLWGVYGVPMWLSIPLSIVAVVGIINAINLIDGVDGLSSGYCIMASLAFGTLFFKVDSVAAMLLCAISISSLLPFFFHNVFGKKSKMFIGDGGSLMMGVIMSSYVVASISSGGACDKCVDMGIGLVPFTLAVMCVPVFDTVRVMFMRILRHTSPFHPDKTHLHHLFIEMGFSHFGTTMCVLSLNALVVLCWYISYRLGASVDTQFYVVVSIGVLLTAGFYKFMRIQIARESAILRWMKGFGAKTHVNDKKWWGALQRTVDLK